MRWGVSSWSVQNRSPLECEPATHFVLRFASAGSKRSTLECEAEENGYVRYLTIYIHPECSPRGVLRGSRCRRCGLLYDCARLDLRRARAAKHRLRRSGGWGCVWGFLPWWGVFFFFCCRPPSCFFLVTD